MNGQGLLNWLSGRKERQESRVLPRFWQDPWVDGDLRKAGENRILGSSVVVGTYLI